MDLSKPNSLFDQTAEIIRQENQKLLNNPEYMKKYTLSVEPEMNTCDECQIYSSDGIKYAGKYFCCEECKEDYTRGVNELKDADKYDQMREMGLESFY